MSPFLKNQLTLHNFLSCPRPFQAICVPFCETANCIIPLHTSKPENHVQLIPFPVFEHFTSYHYLWFFSDLPYGVEFFRTSS